MKCLDQMLWSYCFECWVLSQFFSLSSFTLIRRLFSSSLLSAIILVSSVYMRLLIFLLEILIPAFDSSNPAFYMMCSANNLNKQVDNIQLCHNPFPILNQSLPCLDIFLGKLLNVMKNKCHWDVPRGPAVENSGWNAGDEGSIPDQGTKILYVAGQLSLHHNYCACVPQLESPYAAKKDPSGHSEDPESCWSQTKRIRGTKIIKHSPCVD